jgi:RNA polymerase sigma-70 factor, ECF subfamily
LGNITQLLQQHRDGNLAAQSQLLPLVYAQLRRIAARAMSGERRNITLSPTALVHEAYLRISSESNFTPVDKRTFFVLAAQRMRQVLIDAARERQAQKRGGADLRQVTLTGLQDHTAQNIDVLALDQALNQLQAVDPRRAEVVQLRYFAGLEMAEIGEHLGISRATAQRDWDVAKAFLFSLLG